ncbi:MAG: phosphoenolpyruvate kinase [Acidobacteriota bacterium]
MNRSFSDGSTADLIHRLRQANTAMAARYPGESAHRQPVHTVYGGAHLFRFDTARRLGELAKAAMDTYAPDAVAFAEAIGLAADEMMRQAIYQRVREKLEREAVEDFRIDFEDGYGTRPDDEEDACATEAAAQVARGMVERTLPPFIGIRIKPFSHQLYERGMRTLDIFLTRLLEGTKGRLPSNFVVTLPKVMAPEQVAVLAEFLERIEGSTNLQAGELKLELMIETPQSIIDADGRLALPLLLAAARDRCIAAHFGVYDYTASCNITAQYQQMTHPACDFARHMMQVALAGTGIWLSDGATNVLPVAPHRISPEGPQLSQRQWDENREAVHRAWRLHYEDVRHSLRHAYYQGWDLHPAQFPTRYAAVFSFFLEGLQSASERLRNFIEAAARATLAGGVFDDAATGQALLNFFLRGLNCGAISEEEAVQTGLTLEELRGRSFTEILASRRR